MTDLAWRAEGTGEPVLMIMGLGASATGWNRLLPHVSAGHEAIVFDNRGTGSSPGIDGRITMGDLVADALSVLDAAGHESAHIVGASMGGMIAQHLALEHRDRVRSLLLVCTTPVGRSGQPPWRLLAGVALRPFIEPVEAAKMVAPLLYHERTRTEFPERMAEDLEVRLKEPTPARTSWLQLLAVSGHDTRHRLSELEGIPTTVVHGDDDVLVPTERGRDLAAAIPGARLVIVPHAGHLMTTDNEPDSARAALDHLAWASEVSDRRAA
jgi:pimeloyl-ACP methyl ester carboxylesterase